MQEKHKLSSKFADKLKAYSALTAVAVGSSANAAIQYTDVNPDSTFTNHGDYYDLDLNNDNVPDFRINLVNIQTTTTSGFYYDVKGASINPEYGNAVSASLGSYATYAYALNPNDTIGPKGNFTSTSSIVLGGVVKYNYGGASYTSSLGNFLGQSNKYLSLRIKVGSNTYYGWARVAVAADGTSFTIKDYAYEDSPNTEILAGALTTGIKKVNLAKLIQLNVFNKELKIYSQEVNLQGEEYRLIDMSGKVVQSSILSSNEEKINLSTLSAGMYVVDLRTSEGVLRKKILLEN